MVKEIALFNRPDDAVARRVNAVLPGVQLTGSTGRKVKKIVNAAGVQILAGQAASHIQAEAMRNMSDLVDLARELAGGDPVKEQLLTEMVKAHAQSARVRQTILGW
jgi:hypothetical protein